MHPDRDRAVSDLHQEMRIGVAREQQRLEEHHRHRPHRGRAAEPRQHHLGEQGLHREQQQRADEDRRGIDHQHEAVARLTGLLRRSWLSDGGGGRTHRRIHLRTLQRTLGHSGLGIPAFSPAVAGRAGMEHMATARAMRGKLTIPSLRAVLGCASSLCNSRHSGAPRRGEPGISGFRVWSFGPSRNDRH